ncbi:MAG: hypothetical protein EB015_15225 [Methylocystaceae bacterium]|nr:hypothetical protein [Methylocystaceae bacterium]
MPARQEVVLACGGADVVDRTRRDGCVGGCRAAAAGRADGDAPHGLPVDARLVRREQDAPHGAEALPRHLHPHTLVVERVPDEAHARGLGNHVLAVWVLKGHGARREEAAALALLAWMDEAADGGNNLAIGEGLGVHAAGAVDARLGGLELGCVEEGVLEPLDHVICHDICLPLERGVIYIAPANSSIFFYRYVPK